MQLLSQGVPTEQVDLITQGSIESTLKNPSLQEQVPSSFLVALSKQDKQVFGVISLQVLQE